MVAGRGGRDGRRSGPGKVDDSGDEARGRDARIPVYCDLTSVEYKRGKP